ncbi:MAG TPA: PEP-CTERM sorting domain-containing protein [Spongiibacteraceae bacterium]|nr:PEP-CTERM sorting domain-containing protein [Spongiibacteraceae bacterium]
MRQIEKLKKVVFGKIEINACGRWRENIMKSFLAALLIAVPALAHAYTWDQTINFDPAPQITSKSSYSFTHDLTLPNSGYDNFVVGSDSIDNYSLILGLRNDAIGQIDYVTISQPGLFSSSTLKNWSVRSVTSNETYQGILSLNDSGKLAITISTIFGNFFLDTSELIATGTQGSQASVPEPASIALLAVGLIGIAVMRRTSRA